MRPDGAAEAATQGRPSEIEATTNRLLVHPVSRALVDLLVLTPITPNQVSVASVFAAAAGAACYVALAWPWNALAGLACQFGWHVLDGADGDLARRTGRASPIGELVDGVCDHASQGLLYVAFAIVLQRSLGGWAWALGWAAALSHFVQANAYETGRKTYRRWVYDAVWMRQSHGASEGALQRGLGALYLTFSNLANPGEAAIEALLAPRLAGGGAGAERTRAVYRRLYAPLVSASGLFGSNSRTIAAFLSILAGSPLWFFVYEITVLNLLLAVVTVARLRCDAQLAAALAA